MKASEKQKPDLSVVVATAAAAKIFLRPGMHFRPE